MRFTSTLLAVCVLAGAISSAAAPAVAPWESVLKVTVVRADATMTGSAVLIQRTTGANGTVLYLVTSADLFTTDDTGPRPTTTSIVVRAHSGVQFVVNPEDVDVTSGPVSHLALIQVYTRESGFVPRPVTFTMPELGELFLISGQNAREQSLAVPQRVTRRSSALVFGDRDASAVAPCIGAPAISEAGTFGIVTRCEAGERPEIAPFDIAEGWLTRRVPGLGGGRPVLTRFDVVSRQFTAPVIVASCDVNGTAELSVPLQLSAGELPVDAKVSLLNRSEWPLGTLTVLNVGEDAVKLRFALAPLAKPALPDPCPKGQPLVNLRITALKVAR